jgi:hypothetical protein
MVGAGARLFSFSALNKKQLGNLKLTDQEEDDLVAFLKTLTDGYNVSSPQASK